MCAIFGTSNKEEINTLFEANHDRGGFAVGSLCVMKNNEYAVKKQGGKEIESLIPYPYSFAFNEKFVKYYMFHDQAPTSSVREFTISTSHPFQYGPWIVAHNGVLHDYKHLLEDHDCKVDSTYIPAMLARETGFDEVTAIRNVCNLLHGTFSCWIFNAESGRIYLVKQGSTLFCKNTSFSSVKLPDWESLTDGVIYEIKDSIECVGYFNSNNPFMVLI